MKLRELRTEKGWSQEELAERADVSAEQIVELESDNKTVVTTTHTLLKVAKALDRSVEDVFLRVSRKLTPMKAIRAKCLDCCCGSCGEVRLCSVSNCPLYPYRFGKRPAGDKEPAETEESE